MGAVGYLEVEEKHLRPKALTWALTSH